MTAQKPRKHAALKWSNWYLTALKLAVVLLLVLLVVLFLIFQRMFLQGGDVSGAVKG